jgi:hypothetical protein
MGAHPKGRALGGGNRPKASMRAPSYLRTHAHKHIYYIYLCVYVGARAYIYMQTMRMIRHTCPLVF